jgi:cytochrome c oxidase subunit 2
MSHLLGLQKVASEHGQKVDSFIGYVHLLMAVLFVGWLCYFVFALYRFRQSKSRKANYHGVRSHFTNYLEVGVVGVEAILLVFLAVPLWGDVVGRFPRAEDATVVQVVAQQFAWNFRYAGPDGKFGRQDMARVANDNLFGVDPNDEAGKDDVQVLNEFHVPVNKPVITQISSKDVIHSFRIVAMRSTQDAIPGMRIPMWFKPTETGRFQVYCAQLCGNGHAQMSGGLLVVDTPEDYETWLAANSGAATSFE